MTVVSVTNKTQKDANIVAGSLDGEYSLTLSPT